MTYSCLVLSADKENSCQLIRDITDNEKAHLLMFKKDTTRAAVAQWAYQEKGHRISLNVLESTREYTWTLHSITRQLLRLNNGSGG